MAANIRCIMRAKAPYGQGITKMKVKLTPEQSSTPSLMPETNSVYLTRPTEGTGELMELVGGSVAWNQLCNNGTSPVISASGVTFTVSNGTVTVNGTATANSVCYINGLNATPFISGHKYLMRGCPSGGSSQTYFQRLSVNGSFVAADIGDGVVYACSNTGVYTGVACFVVNGTTVSNKVFKPQLIDLTAYFNPTIADYVYSLEQSTAGSGIAWLKSYGYFTENYIAYSAPTLQSVEATAHVVNGINLLPPSTVSHPDVSYADGYYFTELDTTTATERRLFGNWGSFVSLGLKSGTYTWASTSESISGGKVATVSVRVMEHGTGSSIVWTNGTSRYINEDDTFFILLYYGSTNSHYNCKIGIQFQVGATATAFAPYHAPTTYPFGTTTLRGITELVNGILKYNGDTYSWDGTVTRKYGYVDLGSLVWMRTAVSDHYVLWATVTDKALNFNFILAPYVNAQIVSDCLEDKQAGTYNNTNGMNRITIRDDSYTDAAAFKTAMSGVYCTYELLTQTTESADPYTAVQTVEDGGTEEFVTTNNVPVGVVGRFANAVPMEGVDSFTVTADDGTTHTYPVTLSEEIYRGYVDMLTGEAVSDMASIAEYNGETINSPWLSSLDFYSAGATPTNGAQVVYPITPEEVTATITGDPTELSNVVSVSSTEGTVDWSELSEIGIKCIMKRKNPFQ